ncbi:BTAD domain-containing putative transcriptional regulator [Streptomyces sp. RerS4]|uniref:AfsR/SARP family transcriptional regulator n=1 Tax=Streptomyces sp. RerS4 TaxID=2942449 RepID=UPI00201C5A51|nr:BTAD domain-containing putative transcriptional regulator [Streptomyces sp. RerS4]UQX00927.1 winged helix-turn-helix domain-containing protein [Streptomyces sp. RerS4]
MRYAILGTARVFRDDGSAVAVGGARLRALLTALALRPGRAVPVALLVAEVWDADPPAEAVAALQALVARLRRALGRTAVRSVEGGYLLDARREDVDLYRFEGLVRAAAATPDPAGAAALYDEALALWQGPALASLPDATAEATRWEAVRRDARRGRLGAALALGEAESALPELTELCARYPLDESLQVLRLRALRAAGRPAEALAAYEQVRQTLSGHLGTDPSPSLRTLHTELLTPAEPAHRPPTAPHPHPHPQAQAQVAAGVGQGNLRARLTSFVGREGDIRVIGDDLARARLVTLLGAGGAGKTRLSQEAAEAHAARADGPLAWPDGVWFVELAPVDDPEDVAEAALAALGARRTTLRGAGAEELRAFTDRAGDDPLDRLVDHCARRRLLLLLDNCEHVIGAAAELAERLLTHCPGVRILATSREPLGVPGEFLRPVEPLPPAPAHRLFADRAAAAHPGFDPAEDPAAVAEICRRLDGLPLAIELAAARLRLLTPRQIADRLDDRFRLLTGGARTLLPRQQTLRAVVDWSWDLLDTPERTVLRRLSVFAGGCDLPAAEAVCADPSYEVADILGSLVDKSLVVAEPAPDGMRYRLLETVGEYAAERLAEVDGDRAATERRHLVHYRELARTSEPLLRSHAQRATADRLATEYENLRTALRRAVAARDAQEVLCLVHSLVWYWHMHDLRTESRHWSNAAAELGPDPFAPPVVPAEPVHTRIVDTPPPYSGELLTEGWRGIQMIRLAARDQNSTGWNSPDVRAQVDGMISAYRPGLPQTCRAPSGLWIYAVMIAGDPELLRTVVDETVDVARELGYRWELASALQLRANILANRADWSGDAARDADESLSLFRELGDDWGCAEALAARAESREKRGEYALAALDYREAIEYAERLGAKAQVAVMRVRMAGTLIETGEAALAEEILTEVLATAERYGNEAMPACRMFLASILGRGGRFAEARAQIKALREEFAFGAYAIFDVFLLAIVGWLDNQEARHEDALALVRDALGSGIALDPLALMVAPQLPAGFLLTAAVALSVPEGPRREADAARLLGAYRAHLPPGHVPVSTEREDAARAEEHARAALGDAAYERAYAEGGGLSLEEATALV